MTTTTKKKRVLLDPVLSYNEKKKRRGNNRQWTEDVKGEINVPMQNSIFSHVSKNKHWTMCMNITSVCDQNRKSTVPALGMNEIACLATHTYTHTHKLQQQPIPTTHFF